MDAGFVPPDEVGFELEENGDVVAEAELAWSQAKLVLLMKEHMSSSEVWQAYGWKVRLADGDWHHELIKELSHIGTDQNKKQESQE
jgi:hypothetical protein